MDLKLAALSAVLLSAPLLAHHSFMGEFGVSQPVTITGVVTKVDYTNPHAYVYVDAAENGKTEHWKLEMAAAGVLRSHGWSRDAVKTGDRITASGYRAKHGLSLASVGHVRLPDGSEIVTADTWGYPGIVAGPGCRGCTK
jgi:hypothetical protein